MSLALLSQNVASSIQFQIRQNYDKYYIFSIIFTDTDINGNGKVVKVTTLQLM